MSGYIINPMWFYWMDVLNGLKEFIVILVVLMGVGGVTCLFIYGSDHFLDEEKKHILIRWAKIWAVAMGTLILLALFIPSKETMIQMQLAKFVSYENVESVIEMIQDATDYILEYMK